MQELSTFQIIFILIFSGLISVDRVAGLNIMISRPIVISGILGLVFGNLSASLMMGLVFEFIGLLEVPVGATITHDDSFGGYASSLAVLLGLIHMDAFSILVSIFIISILMYPVTYSDKLFRKLNNYIMQKNIQKHKYDNDNKLIMIGIWHSFVRGIIIYNLGFLVVYIIIYFFNKLNFNSLNIDNPVIALTIIAAFMGGYIIRFLIVNRLYQIIILALGILTGWVLI